MGASQDRRLDEFVAAATHGTDLDAAAAARDLAAQVADVGVYGAVIEGETPTEGLLGEHAALDRSLRVLGEREQHPPLGAGELERRAAKQRTTTTQVEQQGAKYDIGLGIRGANDGGTGVHGQAVGRRVCCGPAQHGAGACCKLPGPQVTTPVCLPFDAGVCDAG